MQPFGDMDFYTVNFLFFLLLNVSLSYIQWNKGHGFLGEWSDSVPTKKVESHEATATHATVSEFKKKFLLVYLLVFAADWLQVRLQRATMVRV